MTDSAVTELLPGYFIDPQARGAWKTLPWPATRELEDEMFGNTLGLGVIEWAESHLIDPQTNLPWKFTPGQAAFLLLWYWIGIDDRWVYRSGVKRGAKGTGKDPLAAAMCLIELMGPARFAGRDSSGRPVGVRHGLPLVQVAANSEAQSKDVLRVANAMVPRTTRQEFGYDAGETRSILADGGGRLELLTASEKTSEGDPATFIALNESHHMTQSSGGHKLADVARRNVGKSPATIQARLVEFTNAHLSGMDSVAERSFEAWQKQLGGTGKYDILYDSIEADPRTKIEVPESLMLGIGQAYSDAPWSDFERIRDEAMDSRTSVGDTVRFYLNGLGVAEDAWVDPNNFDAGARSEMAVERKERVALFLDCSKSDDATAFMGYRLSDGFNFTIDEWSKPHGDRGKGWLVPRGEVDAKVREVFGLYEVAWFGVDPSPAEDESVEANYWMATIDAWHRDFKDRLPNWATPGQHSVLFDMRRSSKGGVDRLKLTTEMCELIAQQVDEDKTLIHDGDPRLRVHVHNARRRPNAFGIGIGKESRSSSKKIDLAFAMVGANVGGRIALNSGKSSKRAGQIW